MSNDGSKKKTSDVPTNTTVSGNALSNIAPPLELPTFVKGVTNLAREKNPMKVTQMIIDATTDFNQVPLYTEDEAAAQQNISLTKRTEDVLGPGRTSTWTAPWSKKSDPPPQANAPVTTPQTNAPVTTPQTTQTSPPTTPQSESSEKPVSIPEPPDKDGFGNVMPGSGLLSWMKDAVAEGGILHRVAEKAKSSVDTMITTLDPQMKEYIRSGGDTVVVVASDKEVKIAPVREAFQTVFGRANVVGYPAQAEVSAAQPVGYEAAYASAKQRIAHIRSTHAELPNNVPVVAIEGFLHEAIADRWYDMSLLVLSQPTLGIELNVQSQGTGVPATAVAALRAATPAEYEHRQTGFATTVGAVMAEQLKVPHTQWQEACTGVSRLEILTLAAKSLAGSYKRFMETGVAASET